MSWSSHHHNHCGHHTGLSKRISSGTWICFCKQVTSQFLHKQGVPKRTEQQRKQQEKKSFLGPQTAPICWDTCFNYRHWANSKAVRNPLWRILLGIVRGLNRAEGMGRRSIFKASQLVSNCWHPASLERQGRDGSQGAPSCSHCREFPHGWHIRNTRAAPSPGTPAWSLGLRNQTLHCCGCTSCA